MSASTESGEEILSWLRGIHLPQYAACFTHAGYLRPEDCGGLTDQRLLEMRVFPTGHRRRILRSLESPGETGAPETGPAGERRAKPVPKPRRVFLNDRKRATLCQRQAAREEAEGQQGRQTLPAGVGSGAKLRAAEGPAGSDASAGGSSKQPGPRKTPPSTSGSSDSLSVSSPSEHASDRETSSEDPAPRSRRRGSRGPWSSTTSTARTGAPMAPPARSPAHNPNPALAPPAPTN
ncbi:hypothetical protein AAFF_G00434410 [Aldrovandia affinis]|uniref:SAM domain-containing protein n=1 Tax=Aldrovandia affinis TaxID=143900 RepID=A0AAD7WI30_9TELE|nr:hypothetical protein AAFF_G00434410 [Aldrovandia affinis]